MNFIEFWAVTSLAILAEAQNDQELLDYRLGARTTKSPFSAFACKEPGVFCKDCSTIVYCQQSQEGFDEVEVGTCGEGTACQDSYCVPRNESSCHLDVEFPCSDLGFFPDPGDCQKYHICVKDDSEGVLKHIAMTCSTEDCNKYGYNPKTTYCDVVLPFEKCEKLPLPLCNYLGEMGVVPENKSIYYRCLKRGNVDLYPYQFVCPNGRVFDVDKKFCKPK